mgnify:CR=1 FL=1
MTANSLTEWMARLGYNKSGAAAALGIARNTLDGYLAGKQPIPRAIALACAALSLGIPEHP